ncbi:MAG TPA: hypothetical protein V6C65_05860 [Allocoleopsis sp.]
MLQRLGQSIAITTLLYLIAGMNHTDSVPTSTHSMAPLLSLAELFPAQDQVAESTSAH